MRLNKSNRILSLVAVVLFVIVCVVGKGVYAKYITQTVLTGSLTVSADIGTITLQEHAVENVNSTGLYKLIGVGNDGKCDGTAHSHVTAETGQNHGNSYQLLPGLDLPKDPHVIIEKDNDMPVYVFVEVCSTLTDSSLEFEVDDNCWLLLETDGTPVTGIHGGTVYVYSKDKTNATVVTNTTSDFVNPVYILENNIVIVNQTLLKNYISDLELTFYACMYQVKSGTAAADTYKDNTNY